jgi:hypothetical protein
VRRKNIDLTVEYHCPQCSAPATLAETDRLFQCDFCRVSSVLIPPQFFSYQFPARAPAGTSLIYVPYWRFKGMQFCCTTRGIQDRFMDLSHAAIDFPQIPASLGLRSQALKLKFASLAPQSRFLRPTLPRDQVLEGFQAQFAGDPKTPVLHQAFVGETLSLIYSPFYVKDRIYDAVLNEPIPASQDVCSTRFEALSVQPPGQLSLVAAICPSCGWNLNGRRDSLVLTCANCHKLWHPAGQGLKSIPFGHLPPTPDTDRFLPFWRIRAEVRGVALASYADLVRLANLPRVVQSGWESLPFHFWSPAFKVRPAAFLRIGRAMTLAQLRADPVARVPEKALQPVTLPLLEAAASLKVTLADVIKPAQKLAQDLPEIRIRPKEFHLIFVPFEAGPHEFVQPEIQLAIERSHLSLAGNL